MKRTVAFLALILLTACMGKGLEDRRARAEDLALSGQLTSSVIAAGPFMLSSWQRLSASHTPANVYIEGDGLAWSNKFTISPNPTPTEPVALALAARDPSPNVIYLARPCQYTGMTGGGNCDRSYWTTGRTAPEVISAYQKALNDIKTQGQIAGFNLIGYSGGAAVAMLTAAKRDDVLSIRTVAGNTHYAAFIGLHHISPLAGSLDPESIAASLSYMPQRHFIGGSDKIVPQSIYKAWETATGQSPCLQMQVIDGVAHEKGWADIWPQLLEEKPFCQGKAAPVIPATAAYP